MKNQPSVRVCTMHKVQIEVTLFSTCIYPVTIVLLSSQRNLPHDSFPARILANPPQALALLTLSRIWKSLVGHDVNRRVRARILDIPRGTFIIIAVRSSRSIGPGSTAFMKHKVR